ncbi:MAG: ABC transporter substrate-binding protein, partial [bacterium]|nr:ABC transporter substrate-binding protein [bacterium]
MRHTTRSRWVALTGVAVVGALALSACSSSTTSESSSSAAAPATSEAAASSAAPASSAAAEECTTPTPVKLQLQWVAQAQFAGYYAAKSLGYYDDACLDVTILEGGVDIVP